MRDVSQQNQPRLFAELVEVTTTRDVAFDDPDGAWGSRISPPPGAGWRVLDAHRERHTRWQRRRPVPLPRRWRRQC